MYRPSSVAYFVVEKPNVARAMIKRALRFSDTLASAGDFLGISQPTLSRYLKKLGMKSGYKPGPKARVRA